MAPIKDDPTIRDHWRCFLACGLIILSPFQYGIDFGLIGGLQAMPGFLKVRSEHSFIFTSYAAHAEHTTRIGVRPRGPRERNRLELVAGPPTAHHVPHVAGGLHELRNRGLRRHQAGSQVVPIRGLSGMYCFEHNHDDDDRYQRALYWTPSQRFGQWIFHDLLTTMVSPILSQIGYCSIYAQTPDDRSCA